MTEALTSLASARKTQGDSHLLGSTSMEAMSSEGVVEERVQPPRSEELALCREDEAEERVQPPRSEELALGSADEAAGGIPFVPTQVPPPVTEELAVGSAEPREEPLQRSEVLAVGSTETREERRARLLAIRSVNPPDIKRSHIPVDKHAIIPAAPWQRRRWHFVDQDNLDRLNDGVLRWWESWKGEGGGEGEGARAPARAATSPKY